MNNLTTYKKSPRNESTLFEMEVACRDRLKLYQLFNSARLHNLEIGTAKWSNFLKSQIREANLKIYINLLDCNEPSRIEEARETNNIGHWLLGLRYCETDELQNEYINFELQWFHLLFMNTSEVMRLDFFKNNNIIFSELSLDRKNKIKYALEQNTRVEDVLNTTFYIADFTRLTEVAAKRTIHLRRGIAHFTGDYLVYIVKRKLKSEFLIVLDYKKSLFGNGNIEDERIRFLLGLLKPITSMRVFSLNDEINLQNIDQVANIHYPPCMKYLHDVLRQENHLKYDCRMQYGVFIYHLGVPYEEAMKLWKDEFTKTISLRDFNKKYEYLFKHQYGLVGRKQPYKPYTCSSILNQYPIRDQRHGCPFKHWSEPDIKNMLENDGCSSNEITDIEDLVQGGYYQKACTEYLCSRRNIDVKKIRIIDSPNQYVVQSFRDGDILDNGCESDNDPTEIP